MSFGFLSGFKNVDNQRRVWQIVIRIWLLVPSMNCSLQTKKFTSRSCRLMIAALWALMLAPCLSLAQSDPPDQTVPPSPEAVQAQASANQAAPSWTIRGPDDPDYWIVSVRHAMSEIILGQEAHYRVLRFDGSNEGRESSMEELLASLEPSAPVCLMVHGSFVRWDSMLVDSSNTYRWIRGAAPDRKVHLIFFTWASDDGLPIPHLHVNQFGRRAALNGLYLADVVSKVSLDHPVCLIGHSHGTRMVSASLHAMAGGEINGKVLNASPLPTRRLRVVLAAAAMDHSWLNRDDRYGLALCPAEAIVNLRNKYDFPLLFYPLRRPIAKRALAITGVTSRDRSKMGDWNEKIVDHDVSDRIGYGHLWRHYYNDPTIAANIRHYVYFDESGSQIH